jgi:NAD(P)-dependent dehydrogenase (short-subunit alcohol dehydrogenase family)
MPLAQLDRRVMFLYFAQCVTVRKDLALLRSSLYSPDPMLLKGRVALVTGSGRGIGPAIARLFASEGASVFLTARTHAELASTPAEINKSGAAAFATADVTKEAYCARVVSAAREKFGPVDILANNAGHYSPVVPVEDYPLAEFDNVLPSICARPSG